MDCCASFGKTVFPADKREKEREGNKHENLARILLFWYSICPLEGRKSQNSGTSNQTGANKKHYQPERSINKLEKERTVKTMERVIFRKEKNPYTKETDYLALFPDDEANPGRVLCLPFSFDGYGTTWFEACCEVDWRYILDKTRIVHKRDAIAETLLKTVSEYFETQFQMMEKYMH